MKIYVSVNKIRVTASIFLIFLYAFTLGLYGKIYRIPAVVVPVTFLVSLSLLVSTLKEKPKIVLMDMLVILMIMVISVFNNYNLKNGSYGQFLFYIVIFAFYILGKRDNVWHSIAISLLMFIGLFYSIMTWVCQLTPSVFYSAQASLFFDSPYYRSMNLLYRNGYNAGITQHYSSNAVYLAMGLIAVSAKISFKNRKLMDYVLFIIIASALLLTGKRAHVLFMIVAICLTYVYTYKKKFGKSAIKLIIGILLFVSIVFIASNYIPELLNVIYRFQENKVAGDFSSGRIIMWIYAMVLFKQNPILGIGWDAFKYVNHLSGALEGLNSHNVFIQLLVETGIVGATPFYLFFIISYIRCLRKVDMVSEFDDNDKAVTDYKMAMFFSLLCQTFFLMYCFTGNPFYDAPTLAPYIMACAMTETTENSYMNLSEKEE